MPRSALTIASCFLLIAGAACAPPRAAEPAAGYRLSGRLEGVADGTPVTLQKAGAYVGFNFEDVAETTVESGRFLFEGSLAAPELHYLQVAGAPRKIPVYLENGEVAVSADPADEAPAEVSGSTSHRLWLELEEGLAVRDARLAALEEEGDAAALRDERERAAAERRDFVLDFVRDHRDSTVAAYALVAKLANSMDYDELAAATAALDPSLARTRHVGELEARLARLAAVQVGREAPDFASLDLDRKAIRLSGFRGRWVLVDFWGSWCGPCRAQNPRLLELYERYRERGFEILGVAFEFGGEEPWRAAIAADGLTWSQASELRGFGEEAALTYAVRALPANVLIDPAGVVAARNLRDEALEARLAELLGR